MNICRGCEFYPPDPNGSNVDLTCAPKPELARLREIAFKMDGLSYVLTPRETIFRIMKIVEEFHEVGAIEDLAACELQAQVRKAIGLPIVVENPTPARVKEKV